MAIDNVPMRRQATTYRYIGRIKSNSWLIYIVIPGCMSEFLAKIQYNYHLPAIRQGRSYNMPATIVVLQMFDTGRSSLCIKTKT